MASDGRWFSPKQAMHDDCAVDPWCFLGNQKLALTFELQHGITIALCAQTKYGTQERPAVYAWFVKWEHQIVPTPSPLDAPSLMSLLMSTAEGQTEAAFPLSFMASSSSSPGLPPIRGLQADVEEIPAFLAIPLKS
jgi:hypothetical protein